MAYLKWLKHVEYGVILIKLHLYFILQWLFYNIFYLVFKTK